MILELLNTLQNYIYSIVAGIVILLVGFGLGILAKKFLLKIFREININKIMSKVGITYDLESWVSSIISYLVYLVTIVIFLDYFNIGSIILYIVLGAILMLIILTFLVGLKDVIPNFIGWLYIQKKDKIKEGHKIEIKEISGVVEKIGYLETEVKTHSGDILYIPNSLFMKSKFKVNI